MNKKPKTVRDTDESVMRMVNEWDIVRCCRCGKKTSMLSSTPIRGGDKFVCKSCIRNN